MPNLQNNALCIGIAFALHLACAHVDTKVEVTSNNALNANNNQDIQIFRDSKPTKEYQVIGKVESHVRRNIFWGGTARLDDEGYKELKAKARAMGGNAVIIDDVIETKAAESSHVHIWAKVILIK